MAKYRLHTCARLIGALIIKKNKEDEIILLNKSLEKRVKERTEELRGKNALLLEEIKERRHVEEDLHKQSKYY